MKSILNLGNGGGGVALAVLLSCATTAQAGPLAFEQGFETDTAGWFDSSSSWYGTVTRVASGTGGITSSSGGFHGIFDQGPAVVPTGATGPFTRFDGYRNTWPGGFTASTDIYLDTGWTLGEGFDFSVAANGSDGNHQRDYIFHVTKDTSTGKLYIGGSNNTNFDPREDLDTLANNAVIDSSGWYTFQHEFYEDSGALAVDLVVFDQLGAELFRETRTDVSDTIPGAVGGNRYGWFTNIDITGGIAVDNSQLFVAPEPTSVAIWSLLGFAAIGFAAYRRRRAA